MARKRQGQGGEGGGAGAAMARRMGWMVLAGAWVFLVVSVASFSPYDAPGHIAAPANAEPVNWCGAVGALVSYKVVRMFGPGAWVLLGAVAMYLAVTGIGRSVGQVWLRGAGAVLAALSVSGFVALLAPEAGVMPEGAGGLLAIFAVEHLAERFDTVGTALILAMVMGVGAMLAVDDLVLRLRSAALGAGRRVLGVVRWPGALVRGIGRVFGWIPWRAMANARVTLPRLRRRKRYRIAHTDLEDVPEVPVRHGARVMTVTKGSAGGEDDGEAGEGEEASGTGRVKKAKGATEKEPGEGSKALDADELREKIKRLPLTIASARKPKSPAEPPKQDLSGYRFPSQELLTEPESNFSEAVADLVREQAEVLERALRTYKIDAEVVAIDAGPVITLYEVRLAPGTKVNSINAIASDVARELKAQNIRIVPNTAGKSTVGVEVPNLKKEKVRLRELMALAGADVFEQARLPMFLGKDASGNPLIADLATMPHMLIAGTTGSGKSVCINSIIMSFLYARRPDELKLVLVDPKMVEMAQFRDIPHLMCPVVTEMGKAAAILEWAVTKMEERYELLAEAGVRDIDGYNGLEWEELRERFEPSTEEEEAKIPRKLPRMVYVIDELADLILTHKEVEGFIVRIAQKARAVGIHLILATQRPQANVVTGLIKSNMPCRVSFKVSSGMDSRIVLDAKGAELLLGQGDMLYLSPRTSKLARAQGTLVDDREVRAVVRFLKQVASQSFEPQLVQLRGAGATGEDDEPMERDELFDDAVEVVLETKRGSVSLLQRRLTIGYSRASRLIEQMAEAGIIGEYKGSQAREVNITLEEWQAMKAQMAADLEAGYAADEPDADGEAGEAAEEAPFDATDGDEEEGEEEGEYEEGEADDDEEEYEYVEEDDDRK